MTTMLISMIIDGLRPGLLLGFNNKFGRRETLMFSTINH
jgi:hypothetical protein